MLGGNPSVGLSSKHYPVEAIQWAILAYDYQASIPLSDAAFHDMVRI